MSNPIFIPDFIEGKHYKTLSPKEGKYKYRYATLDDIEIKFRYRIISSNKKIEYTDQSGNVWLTIENYSIIVSKNYAWNGCSPKRWFIFWVGTPDFQETTLASMVHDSLVQFCQDTTFPYTRPQCDEIFKCILSLKNFKYTDIYYKGAKFGTDILPCEKYTGKSLLTIQLRD